MESLLQISSSPFFPPNFSNSVTGNGDVSLKRNSCLVIANGRSSPWQFSCQNLSLKLRESMIVRAKKSKNNKKGDSHSFVPKPDEATGMFPEAVLLKEKKVQEDGKFLPEFADEEEEKLFEFLNLQLESDLNVEQIRHYEVVYLIHEKHEEEVGKVTEKIEDFLTEKKGRIWRQSDWGLRRLAYKIQKATQAHYILMNFELEAKWINDFKSILDKDERVIRHLVIKRDKAITEECPPPPEFHTLRGDMDDYDEDEDEDDDLEFEEEDGDWDDEGVGEGKAIEEGIIIVDNYDSSNKSDTSSSKTKRNPSGQKVGR